MLYESLRTSKCQMAKIRFQIISIICYLKSIRFLKSNDSILKFATENYVADDYMDECILCPSNSQGSTDVLSHPIVTIWIVWTALKKRLWFRNIKMQVSHGLQFNWKWMQAYWRMLRDSLSTKLLLCQQSVFRFYLCPGKDPLPLYFGHTFDVLSVQFSAGMTDGPWKGSNTSLSMLYGIWIAWSKLSRYWWM